MNIQSFVQLLILGIALASATTAGQAQTSLISTGTVWRYLDDGSDQGTAWRSPVFDDSSWASGVGLFGAESPGIYAEPIRTPLPTGGGRVTYYFRTHFTCTGTWRYDSNEVLLATASIDDGAVFYWNGAEVGRVRLTNQPVTFSTLAQNQGNEGTMDVFTISATNIVDGDNVLAVEVHQTSANSSDLVFGLTLLNTNSSSPRITQQPQSLTVTQGQTATFSVAATGTPPLSYHWRRHTEPINHGSNAVFSLPNAQFSDAGDYDVIVSNYVGSVTSAVAVLTVVPATPGYLSFKNRETTSPSLAARFFGPEPGDPTLAKFGNPTNGNPQGTQVYNGPPLTGTNYTCELWGGPLETGDAGLAAIAQTTTWLAASLAGFINPAMPAVQVPNVPAGSNAWVQFRVWDNQGGTITSWAAAQANPNVASGASQAFASLSLGSNAASAVHLTGARSFNIHYQPAAPVITMQPQSLTVTQGQTATLSVAATGTPPLTYEWRLIGAPAGAVAGTSSTLIISNAQPQDAGSYFVIVRNAYGAVSAGPVTLAVWPLAELHVTASYAGASGDCCCWDFSLVQKWGAGGNVAYVVAQVPAGVTVCSASGPGTTTWSPTSTTIRWDIPGGLQVIWPDPFGIPEIVQACFRGIGSGGVTLTFTGYDSQGGTDPLLVDTVTIGDSGECGTPCPTNKYVFVAGVNDGYAAPADPAVVAGNLGQINPLPTWKPFDDATCNQWVGHTFQGLPSCILQAQLQIVARPGANCGFLVNNDTISLAPDASGTFAWGAALSALPEAGGTWGANPSTTFTLNLGSLPSANGPVDLLPLLNAQGFLDVAVQDDTEVDYLQLCVWTGPVFTNCHTNIVVDCRDDPGAVVCHSPPNATVCPPAVLLSLTCVPPPCSLFPIGVTPVVCTAVDSCGSSNTCCFSVTVRGHGYDAWTWARQAGSGPTAGGPDTGHAVAVDTEGRVYVTGSYRDFLSFVGGSVILPPFAGNNNDDVFLAQYNQAGVLQWAVRAGGAGDDAGYGVAVDDDGNAYVTGGFSGSADFESFPSTPAFTLNSTGGSLDAFAAKYDANGVCVWARRFGGPGDDRGAGIAARPDGSQIYVVGDQQNGGVAQAFVRRLDAFGNVLGPVVFTALNGSGSQFGRGRAIALDAAGDVYVAGTYGGPTMFVGIPSFTGSVLASPNGARLFVARFTPTLAGLWAEHSDHTGPAASGNHDAMGIAMKADPASGQLACYVTAYFYGLGGVNGTANFGAGRFVTSTKGLGSNGDQLSDYLIVKFDAANAAPIWAIRGGGPSADSEETRDVAVDPDGHPCVTGFVRPNAPANSVNEGRTVIVKSYDRVTGALRWTRHAVDGAAHANAPENVGLGLAVDAAGCVHVTGAFTEDLEFPPVGLPVATLNALPPVRRNMFVGKMCPTCGCEGRDLVCNGSFEGPVVSPPDNYDQFASVPCWTGRDSAGNAALIELWNGTFGNMLAQHGQQHLEINADIVNESVSQTVTGLDPHCPATLSFWFAGRPGFVDNAFRVEVLNSSLTPILSADRYPAPYVSPASWQPFTSLPFLPTPTMTIRFTALSNPSITGGAHIDHVSLVQGASLPGMQACCASLCGVKFNDLDNDGVQDAGEPGVAGFTIVANDSTGNVVDSAVTDSQGNYCLTVPAGSYLVCEVPQAPQWLQTSAPLCHPVTAGPGAILTGLNFGNNCSQPQGTLVFQAGFTDNFGGSFETAVPGACLLSKYPGPWKNFDDPQSNRRMGHTFFGLPANIVGATLVVALRPNADIPGNDTIHVGLVEHTAGPPFCAAGGPTWLSTAPFPGAGNYTLVFTGPLLAKLTSDRFLDVLVQDDHTVDWMQLTIRTCDAPGDSDGDGLPDYWELAHGFDPANPSDATLDPDGDGATNQQEFQAGANPLALNVSGPQISIQPREQTVPAGGLASATVVVTGFIPISYQWQFNGTNIAGATNATLTVSNVYSAASGIYTAAVAYREIKTNETMGLEWPECEIRAFFPPDVAATLDPQGILTVIGKDLEDDIEIYLRPGDTNTLEIDDVKGGVGVDFSFPVSSIRKLFVDVGAGNDRVLCNDTNGLVVDGRFPVELHGGDGDDIVIGSSALVNMTVVNDVVALRQVMADLQAGAAALRQFAATNFDAPATNLEAQVAGEVMGPASRLLDDIQAFTGDETTHWTGVLALGTFTNDLARLQSEVATFVAAHPDPNLPPAARAELDMLLEQIEQRAAQFETDAQNFSDGTLSNLLARTDAFAAREQIIVARAASLAGDAQALGRVADELERMAEALAAQVVALVSRAAAPPPLAAGPSPLPNPACTCNTPGGNLMIGSAGSDFMFGTGGSDWMQGFIGDDILFGFSGNDEMVGGEGNDFLFGGDGDDCLYGDDVTPLSAGVDWLFGGTGHDRLEGGGSGDFLFGESGDDCLYGDEFPVFAGHDRMYGGAGADYMEGGQGHDGMSGGSGQDSMYGDGDASNPLPFGNDWIYGGPDKDYLNGGPLNDWIFGDGDDDLVEGGDGDDLIRGGDGHDVLNGDSNLFFDVIFGDDGIDTISGGDFRDFISGGAGDDLIYGGATSGSLFDLGDLIQGDDGNDTIFGGDGVDLIAGGPGADQIFGQRHADLISGGAEDDFLSGDEGPDLLLGDGGNDLMGGGAGADLQIGGPGADILDGGDGSDLLWGLSQDDTLYGKSGLDFLDGGFDRDTLLGGADTDLLLGRFHDDVLAGEDGRDVIHGNAGNDYLFGGAENDVLMGGLGSDTGFGEGGADALIGGLGDDCLDGGPGTDFLHGGPDQDTLLGNDGNDHPLNFPPGGLFGGPGNDKLDGGPGNDYLDGGLGTDDAYGGGGFNFFLFCESVDSAGSLGDPCDEVPYQPIYSICGVKWLDQNGNGVRDGGEPLLPGVTFYLDYNSNGTLDIGEPTAVSAFDNPGTTQDETGTYCFSPVPEGTYKVCEVAVAPLIQTYPPSGGCHVVTIGSLSPSVTCDFGNRCGPTNTPVFLSARGKGNKVTLNFNSLLDPACVLDPTHYTVSPGVTVTGVSFGADGQTLCLAVTPPLVAGQVYTVQISSFCDLCGNQGAAGAAWDFEARRVGAVIAFTREGADLVFRGDEPGILQQAETIVGPWTDVPLSNNGLRVTPTGDARYFRWRLIAER